MCRCCQSCLEDIYWNCIEEKFCFDESIANYNPDEDDIVTKNHIQIVNGIGNGRLSIDNNNMPICSQPLNRNNSTLMSGKMHEEDFRREIQTSVPILAPEILAVFSNSQIFQEHQPKGISRVNTKSYLPGIHTSSIKDKLENDQEKLLFHLEGHQSLSQANSKSDVSTIGTESTNHSEKRIKFTLSDSPLEFSAPSLSTQKFPIIEELIDEDISTNTNSDTFPITNKKKNSNSSSSISSTPNKDNSEVILRPRLRTNEDPISILRKNAIGKNTLRNVNSLPYFSVRPVASENDIFSISLASGSSYGQLSMTPEIPSISYSALPKNYEDTPTIEKYKESVSLFSIQTANQAEADNKIVDYSMPRYFRMTMTQSVENVTTTSGTRSNYTSRDNVNQHIKRPEKSRRLKNLRGSLPPLLIHAVRKKDDSKQVN